MRTQPGWSLDTSLWGDIWHVVVSCQVCVLLHKHGPKVSFREITASLVYFFILAALCGMRDLSSLTRLNPRTLHWKWGILTTGPPRKSPSMFIDNYEMEVLHLISRASWRGSLGSDLKVTTEQKKRSMSKPHIARVPGLLYTPFYWQLSWTLLDKLSSSERVQWLYQSFTGCIWRACHLCSFLSIPHQGFRGLFWAANNGLKADFCTSWVLSLLPLLQFLFPKMAHNFTKNL